MGLGVRRVNLVKYWSDGCGRKEEGDFPGGS